MWQVKCKIYVINRTVKLTDMKAYLCLTFVSQLASQFVAIISKVAVWAVCAVLVVWAVWADWADWAV